MRLARLVALLAAIVVPITFLSSFMSQAAATSILMQSHHVVTYLYGSSGAPADGWYPEAAVQLLGGSDWEGAGSSSGVSRVHSRQRVVSKTHGARGIGRRWRIDECNCQIVLREMCENKHMR